MQKDSITDTSKPNAGRIYDYLLGGSHNFEVDRLAAGQLVQMFPFLPKSMRLQRWCLQDLAVELSKKRGFNVIIDFASGLPTNDHLHIAAVPGTTIIYSDWDPVVVEYGREILKGVENVYYFHADARHPEELLNRPEVQNILKDRRDVAFITWGLSTFLEDEDIVHMARALYDWADKKSVWAFNAQGGIKTVDNATPGILKLIEFYKQMGTPVYYRSEEKYIEMLKPWRLEGGFVAFLDWHGLDKSFMTDEDLRSAGPGGGGYGAYLIK
jgi:SAM-dependent methyltransferase